MNEKWKHAELEAVESLRKQQKTQKLEAFLISWGKLNVIPSFYQQSLLRANYSLPYFMKV